MKIPNAFELLKNYFVEQPKAITGLKTIQIYLYREVLDYTVLRTEEDREINTIVTPAMIGLGEVKTRVAFLGSKQKAVESRQLERLLRTSAEDAGYKIEECYLKDHLCLECPRCGLFGGTNASSSKKTKSNIKHRIAYSTAFSLDSVDDLREAITFNGISDQSQTTGQTLGERVAVKPGTFFPSIVTLTGVTWLEVVLVLKTLLSSHKYGAESRIGGDIRNHVVGIAAGWEEVMTPLEFTLEMQAADEMNEGYVERIIQRYAEGAGNPEKIRVLNSEELSQVLETARKQPLDREFLTAAFDHIKQMRKEQESK
ncbi:type I-D CRISPR-associated protein Cas7/Csc2 [Tumebacillus avium]|uniref:Type I-D CRISPR-associated protein Cas7/Csc2 n=1 Tax=Tumebacillus avium TaxID=1903704 RepID=A0A1Y0INW7_9BACL|nr:type I-D CRISPR-associated protein Cas7/Csc2 [Tumebacillus avium]ARU61526.1 type I-D CRISPR-associated protein Cas7/Csc2 [Tumebacillus avium]